MRIIDAHSDALLKIWRNPTKVRFRDSHELHTNLNRLQAGQVTVQFFAIFVPSHVNSDQKFQAALEQIDLFHSEIITKHSVMKHITSWQDIYKLQSHEIGAILTLEGADAFGDDLVKLRLLYQLGVMSIGITWNHANLCADGVGEPRGAGLTQLGKQVVEMNNEHQVLTDVSHLSESAFWDVMNIAKYPIATHSNAKAICDHPRNLTDQQAQQLFQQNGIVGVVFYPLFLRSNGVADIHDIIRHIDHFCSIGGVSRIGFGSDFDGIDKRVDRLEDASMYSQLIDELLQHYKEEEVKGFAYQNFLDHIPIVANKTIHGV